jgi:hypothetical protein
VFTLLDCLSLECYRHRKPKTVLIEKSICLLNSLTVFKLLGQGAYNIYFKYRTSLRMMLLTNKAIAINTMNNGNLIKTNGIPIIYVKI